MNQKANPAPAPGNSFLGRIGGLFCRYPKWTGAAVALAFFGFFAIPHRDDPNDFHYRDFGRWPVTDQGRVKPLDTSARNNLTVLTHRQAFYNRETKVTMPATKWFLDSTTVPMPGNEALAKLFANSDSDAWNYRVFRIENDVVLRKLGLQMRDGLRYSLREIADKFGPLQKEAAEIAGDEERGIKAKDPKSYSVVDAKIMELYQHVRLYMNMATHSSPLVIPNADKDSDQWKSLLAFMQEAMENGGQLGDGDDAKACKTYLQLLAVYSEGSDPEWSEADKKSDLARRHKKFNELLTAHLTELQRTQPDLMRRIDTEVFFNEFEPFFLCQIMYVLIALVTVGSWLVGPTAAGTAMRKAAFAAMLVTFAVHLFGLCLRMYLQDRYFVFVTNLYSSAVFIGFGCVAFCMVGEWITKYGIAMTVGSVLAFLSLIIAHLLSLDGDTMVMMQAVLDTNLWLRTHVTCVSIGYVTVAVAGLMGVAYILLGILTNMLRGTVGADLIRVTYGVLCTGMFFSFVGTVLGGLWADYSWGRFWGWDPKENGALLIVIWVALILHARWGGLVKHRGIAILSTMGLIVVAWSWFGTNFLGIGLHAYGGAQGTAMAAMVGIDFVILGIALLGLLPLEHWQSFRPLPKVDAPVTTPPVPPTAIKAPATV